MKEKNTIQRKIKKMKKLSLNERKIVLMQKIHKKH